MHSFLHDFWYKNLRETAEGVRGITMTTAPPTWNSHKQFTHYEREFECYLVRDALLVDGLDFRSGSYYYISFAVPTLDKTCARGTVASPVNNAVTGQTRIAKDVTNVSTKLQFPAQSAPHQESMHLAWKVINNTQHSGRLIVLHGICVTVYKGHQSQIQNESGIYRQCKERESK
jgi:hypothetical protein